MIQNQSVDRVFPWDGRGCPRGTKWSARRSSLCHSCVYGAGREREAAGGASVSFLCNRTT